MRLAWSLRIIQALPKRTKTRHRKTRNLRTENGLLASRVPLIWARRGRRWRAWEREAGEEEGDPPNATCQRSPATTVLFVVGVVEQRGNGACQVSHFVLGRGEAHGIDTKTLVARSRPRGNMTMASARPVGDTRTRSSRRTRGTSGMTMVGGRHGDQEKELYSGLSVPGQRESRGRGREEGMEGLWKRKAAFG